MYRRRQLFGAIVAFRGKESRLKRPAIATGDDDGGMGALAHTRVLNSTRRGVVAFTLHVAGGVRAPWVGFNEGRRYSKVEGDGGGGAHATGACGVC